MDFTARGDLQPETAGGVGGAERLQDRSRQSDQRRWALALPKWTKWRRNKAWHLFFVRSLIFVCSLFSFSFDHNQRIF
jgi:hypothetical protein